jgi:hypothetical protein
VNRVRALAWLLTCVAFNVDAADCGPAREAQSLQAVCAKCHNLELVTDTPRSFEEWQDTIQQMVDRGAKGTDAQFDDILDLLHRTLTTINVNTAEASELQIVLDIPQGVSAAIIERRSKQLFTGLDDLKTVQGLDPAAVDARASLIFFK